MGYQESYVTTVNEKDFTGLCDYIRSVGKDYYNTHMTLPVEIITLESGKRTFTFRAKDICRTTKQGFWVIYQTMMILTRKRED